MERKLADGDIQEIAALVKTAIEEMPTHKCQYDIPPEALRKIVEFVTKQMELIESAEKTLIIGFVKAIFWFLIATLGIGLSYQLYIAAVKFGRGG